MYRPINSADAHNDVEIITSLIEILFGHPKPELVGRIVKRFGTVTRLFGATEAELAEVGLPTRAIVFFTKARPAYRQALIREAEGLRVTCECALFKYALAAFGGERQNSAVALLTDGKGKALGMEPLPSGDFARAAVGELCRVGAARLALLVGSPTGFSDPSTKTLKTVLAVVGTLEELGAEFIDFVTYAPDKFFSLRRMTDGRENPVTLEQADYAPFAALGGFTECVEGKIAERTQRLSTAFLDLSESRLI